MKRKASLQLGLDFATSAPFVPPPKTGAQLDAEIAAELAALAVAATTKARTAGFIEAIDGGEGTELIVSERNDGRFAVALRDTDADEIVGGVTIYPTRESALASARETARRSIARTSPAPASAPAPKVKAPKLKKPNKAEREKAAKDELARAMFTSGERAWAIISKAIGDNAKNKDRRQIEGAAQVRIEDGRGDRIRVLIIAGSPSHLNGRTMELRHGDVYPDTRDGRIAFKRDADRFWGPESRKK